MSAQDFPKVKVSCQSDGLAKFVASITGVTCWITKMFFGFLADQGIGSKDFSYQCKHGIRISFASFFLSFIQPINNQSINQQPINN